MMPHSGSAAQPSSRRRSLSRDSTRHPFGLRNQPNSELANLQLHWLRADSGIKIPCFRNGKALKEGDRLMYFKEKRKAEVAPLEQSPGKTKVHAPAKRRRTADAAE